MSRLSRVLHDELTELRSALGTFRDGGPTALEWFVPKLMRLVEGDRALCLQLAINEEAMDVEGFTCMGVPTAPARASFQRVVSSSTMDWTNWNPMLPDPKERNRACSVVAALGWEKLRAPRIYREAAAPNGLGNRDQLRALICDGPALLGWVGAFREEPFAAHEVRLYQELVPALQRRMLLEQQLQRLPHAQAELAAALEAIHGAAFILSRAGRVQHANAAGRALLERDDAATRAALRLELGSSAPGRFALTRIVAQGAPVEHLAVEARPRTLEAAARTLALARRWSLTPRQAQVLELLAAGRSNKLVAVLLHCAERTIEMHVTALFGRVQAASRAELVARFWTEDV